MIPPNFFIIGAPRAATTFLYRAVMEHPRIFMSSVKETGFFSFDKRNPELYVPVPRTNDVRSWPEYLGLFASGSTYAIRGEASTGYLADAHAAQQIKSRLGLVPRFIAVLRNPIERAYSHFVYHRMLNVEPATTFEEALADEPRRREQNWNRQWRYQETGLYGQHLENYFNLFKPEQFLILLHEDFLNPQKTFERVFQFLEVGPWSVELEDQVNQSGVSRGSLASWLLQSKNPVKLIARRILPATARRRLRSHLTDKPPEISPNTRNALLAYYREDIEKTQQLIGRNLEHWRR